jgi:hypothetical protein
MRISPQAFLRFSCVLQSFTSFQLDRPQMLKDLFGRIPLLGMTMTSLVAVRSIIHPGPDFPGQDNELGSPVTEADSPNPYHELPYRSRELL